MSSPEVTILLDIRSESRNIPRSRSLVVSGEGLHMNNCQISSSVFAVLSNMNSNVTSQKESQRGSAL